MSQTKAHQSGDPVLPAPAFSRRLMRGGRTAAGANLRTKFPLIERWEGPIRWLLRNLGLILWPRGCVQPAGVDTYLYPARPQKPLLVPRRSLLDPANPLIHRLDSPARRHPYRGGLCSTGQQAAAMPRSLHVPGVAFIVCAFVLLFLVSVSLPWLPALDITRVHFEGTSSTGSGDQHPLTELRVSPRCCFFRNVPSRATILSPERIVLLPFCMAS